MIIATETIGDALRTGRVQVILKKAKKSRYAVVIYWHAGIQNFPDVIPVSSERDGFREFDAAVARVKKMLKV